MKKSLIALLLVGTLVFVYSTVYARGGDGKSKGYGQSTYKNYTEDVKVKDFLTTLTEKYSLKREELDPEKIAETDLEILGNLLFEARHGTGKDSEYMKKAMGGDEENFKYMLQHMGYRYLDGEGYGRGHMMGGNGNNMMGGNGHMGGWFGRGNKGNYNDDTALEILKKRFANGEITEEEYKKAKEILAE